LAVKLVLDTSAYIDFAQGSSDVVELLAARGSEIFLPSPVLGELFFGFMRGSRSAYNKEKLHDFIASLGVSVIDVTEEIARKYALIFLSVTAKGTRIPVNDVWIAACCMGVGGTLITRDRHFGHVEQIDKMILPDKP
jgi:predicted nucleic acid-binding protein